MRFLKQSEEQTWPRPGNKNSILSRNRLRIAMALPERPEKEATEEETLVLPDLHSILEGTVAGKRWARGRPWRSVAHGSLRKRSNWSAVRGLGAEVLPSQKPKKRMTNGPLALKDVLWWSQHLDFHQLDTFGITVPETTSNIFFIFLVCWNGRMAQWISILWFSQGSSWGVSHFQGIRLYIYCLIRSIYGPIKKQKPHNNMRIIYICCRERERPLPNITCINTINQVTATAIFLFASMFLCLA